MMQEEAKGGEIIILVSQCKNTYLCIIILTVMKYLFEIDDQSKTGKNILPLLKDLSKSGKGIDYLSEEDAEDRSMICQIRESIVKYRKLKQDLFQASSSATLAKLKKYGD
jgi:hypothetical protein